MRNNDIVNEDTQRAVTSGSGQVRKEPFFEPKLTKHGDATKITAGFMKMDDGAGFFGSFSP